MAVAVRAAPRDHVSCRVPCASRLSRVCSLLRPERAGARARPGDSIVYTDDDDDRTTTTSADGPAGDARGRGSGVRTRCSSRLFDNKNHVPISGCAVEKRLRWWCARGAGTGRAGRPRGLRAARTQSVRLHATQVGLEAHEMRRLGTNPGGPKGSPPISRCSTELSQLPPHLTAAAFRAVWPSGLLHALSGAAQASLRSSSGISDPLVRYLPACVPGETAA